MNPTNPPAKPSPPAPIKLAEKFAQFSEHWSPKIVAALNGQHVKLVKFRGEFVWHQHADEDELFLVVRGSFRMEFRDRPAGSASRIVTLSEGELIVVPKGVEHRPVADEEVCVLLFEPATTMNTGNAGGPRTVAQPAWI
jgi:mannose-6-phosphate isomerase-like protein (cupin superfamily)